MTDRADTQDPRAARAGLLCGVLAYGSWGVFPLYFKLLSSVPALEVLAHRILWSAPLLAILILAAGRTRAAAAALRSGPMRLALAASTALIAINWYFYLWAVEHGAVLQASLGYFINPLINVLLGVAVLRERLRPAQALSVAVAALGVACIALRAGLPWVSLTLACSFALYGFVRKLARIDPLIGLAVETSVLVPPAAWLALGPAAVAPFGRADPHLTTLLILSGPLTAAPLLLFGVAARRLRLSTLGFVQYLAPTLQFLLAVLVFRESFDPGRLAGFALIWSALLLFTLDAWRAPRPLAEAPAP